MSTDSLPSPESRARRSLSLILPGLNEEANVVRALERAVPALERVCDEFEIIVIDDGSTDRTAALAEKFAAGDARVRVLRNDRNRNYGVSLRRGIGEARCDWILHNGMDLPLALEDIEPFVELFEEADVIVAIRPDVDAHSRWRRLTHWTNLLLLRLLFAPGCSDLNFTQFYRRAILEDMRLISTSPAFVTPELILRAERTGRRVRQLEATFRRREAGVAHFGRPKDIVWTLRDMLRLRWQTWLRGWDA